MVGRRFAAARRLRTVNVRVRRVLEVRLIQRAKDLRLALLDTRRPLLHALLELVVGQQRRHLATAGEVRDGPLLANALEVLALRFGSSRHPAAHRGGHELAGSAMRAKDEAMTSCLADPSSHADGDEEVEDASANRVVELLHSRTEEIVYRPLGLVLLRAREPTLQHSSYVGSIGTRDENGLAIQEGCTRQSWRRGTLHIEDVVKVTHDLVHDAHYCHKLTGDVEGAGRSRSANVGDG